MNIPRDKFLFVTADDLGEIISSGFADKYNQHIDSVSLTELSSNGAETLAKRFADFTTIVFLFLRKHNEHILASGFLPHIKDRTNVLFIFDANDGPSIVNGKVKVIYSGSIYDIPHKDNIIQQLINNRIDGGTLNIRKTNLHLTFSEDLISSLAKLFSNSTTFQNLPKFSKCISYSDVSLETIINSIQDYVPTAYGEVHFSDEKEDCLTKIDLSDIVSLLQNPFTTLDRSLVSLVTKLQGNVHSDTKVRSDPEDFVFTDERLIQRLFGSSASHLLLLESDITHKQFVRKIAVRGGIEGNGSPKLNAEIQFLRYLESKQSFHKLKDFYPSVFHSDITDTYSLLDLEYIGNGKNVFTLLSSQDSSVSQSYKSLLNDLLSTIISYGYLLRHTKNDSAKSFELLEDYYLRRAEARLRYLYVTEFNIDFPTGTLKDLSPLADHKRNLVINNRRYVNPLEIIESIRNDKKLLNRLRPVYSGFCAHGDLTFLNMVFDSNRIQFRPIDSRGHIGNWDPLYDFGKLKFTLSGFGKIINREFTLIEDKNGAFELSLTGNPANLEYVSNLNASFLDDIYRNMSFKVLVNGEPYWRERILFAEAVHYLADIPYRLFLDQSPKVAVATFLLGTKCLNEAYEYIRRTQ